MAVRTLEYYQGDHRQAATYYREALALFHEQDSQYGMAYALMNLGDLARRDGDFGQADELFRQSLTLFWDERAKSGIALCLAALAAVSGAGGQALRAARLFGAAEAALEAAGSPLNPADLAERERDIAACRAQLDDSTWAAAWAEGHWMTLEQANTYALEADS